MPEAKEISYPTWRYHKTEDARVVASAEEDAELGKEWADKPFEKADDAPDDQFASADAIAEQKASKKKAAKA